MIKNTFVFSLFFFIINIQAQVGINIDNPKRTLDINGGLTISPTNVEDAVSKTTDATSLLQEYSKVMVSNRRGNVDYVNLSDFNAFSIRGFKYKTKQISIPNPLPANATIIDDSEFVFKGYLKFKLSVTFNNKLQFLITRDSNVKTFVCGRVLHDGGIIQISRDLNDNDAYPITATGLLGYIDPNSNFGFKKIQITVFKEGNLDKLLMIDIQTSILNISGKKDLFVSYGYMEF